MMMVSRPIDPTTASREDLMNLWTNCITSGKTIAPYDAVVAELAEYYKLSAEEVHQRCQNWEDESVAQWHAEDRSSPEKVVEFFQTQTSWVFDTMRYHAEQCVGKDFPESVEIAHGLPQMKPGYHLDFGCGPGSSSLLFHALGWKVALSDISTTFLSFAKWRLEKHGVPATFYDTSQEHLPSETFDLITAFDVMVHIPNVRSALQEIHQALRPGGYFVFNIDSRPRGPTTEYHFFESHYPVLQPIRRIGFRRHEKISFFYLYQKVNMSPMQRRFISFYDDIRYNEIILHAKKGIYQAKSLLHKR